MKTKISRQPFEALRSPQALEEGQVNLWLIIGLIILIVLGVGGIFAWKSIFTSETKDGEEGLGKLPGPLAEYLAARTCGNGVCEIGENSKSCPRDCLPVQIRADRWAQVSGPYGGWITDLEKAGDALWAGTSFTYGLGGNATLDLTSPKLVI